MPCLQVKVNFALDAAAKANAAAQFSKLVARLTGKPEAYVMVVVEDGAAISMGGDAAGNACFMDLRSIGAISRSANKTYSAALCKLASEVLSVESERVYINFQSYAGENWGFDGTTFG